MGFWKLYFRYLRMVKKYKWLYIIYWILLTLFLLSTNVSYYFLGTLIDRISVSGEVYEIVFLITGLLIIPIPLESLTFFIKGLMFTKLLGDVYSQSFAHVLDLDFGYHINKQTGKLITILSKADEVILTFSWGLEWEVFDSLASLLVPTVILFTISPVIGLIFICISILFLPFNLKALKYNIRKRNIMRSKSYLVQNEIVDSIGNFETVKSFGKEDTTVGVFLGILEEYKAGVFAYQNTFRLLDIITRLYGISIFVAGTGYAAWQFQKGELTLGFLVVVITYLLRLSEQSFGLLYRIRNVIKQYTYAEDYFGLMDEDVLIKPPQNPISIEAPEGEVRFENVVFKYNDNGKRVVSGLNLAIKARDSIALVGPSGGGKTTLIKLLLRYYDVDNGRILIDGVDVRDLSNDQLRELIGIVPQEPVLFNRSLFFNVAYGLDLELKGTEEGIKLVEQACRRAQIHDFITSLPEGYETLVGERGLKLSGGQKQRVAIARVLLKDPRIVVFDEATSMLDSESEQAIQKAFRELSRDKTTIVIAHRLSTIVQSDKIFVIEGGKVIEEGTHSELLSNGGLYKSLWDIQSGGFVQET